MKLNALEKLTIERTGCEVAAAAAK